jgi:hypothetical protein
MADLGDQKRSNLASIYKTTITKTKGSAPIPKDGFADCFLEKMGGYFYKMGGFKQ